MGTFGRRAISIIMSVIMVLSCFAGLTFSVGAETSGDYEYEVLDDGTVSITKYNGSDEEVTIPSEIDGKNVTKIGEFAFWRYSKLISINLPNSILEISEAAFGECSNLVNIDIAKSVIKIGKSAFQNCVALKEIHIPYSVTEIGEGAFIGCKNLKEISIPASVKEIKSSVFYRCSSLIYIDVDKDNKCYISDNGVLYSKDKSILMSYPQNMSNTTYSIPKGVLLIDDFAFSGCSYLERIELPETITEIGQYAFSGCDNIESIDIPKNVNKIGGRAFFGCNNLSILDVDINNNFFASVDGVIFSKDKGTLMFCPNGKQGDYIIPDNVKIITADSFAGCEKLTNIKVAKSVVEINTGTFYGCYSLKSIIVDELNVVYSSLDGVLFNKDKTIIKFMPHAKTNDYRIPDNVEVIDSGAFYESSLSRIIIPLSVFEIKDYAFKGCSNLSNVELSNNIKEIGFEVFYGCSSLKEVIIPNGVSTIDTWTFLDCVNLKTIIIPDSVTNIDPMAFMGCSKLTIYCNPESAANKTSFYSDELGKNKIPVKYITDTPAEKCIAVFSTERSLSINPGGSFNLGFGITDGEAVDFDSEWKQMSLSVGDPSVISVSDYVKTDCGYYVTVTGLKEGKSSVTVTDTDSGANMVIEITVSDDYIKTYSYKIDKMREFYPDNNRENHLLTNIYNQNGLYVNNYKCEKESGKYHVTFDVYNETYYAGAVDIYDKNGLWQGYCEIKKNHDISSLKDTIDQTYYLISDYINKKLITYAQRGSSEYTNIDIYIPEGGYFTISNNMLTSPGTYLTNAFEIVFDAATSALSLILSDSVKTSALSDFKKEMGKDFTQKLIDTVNEQKSEAKKKAMQKVLLGSMQDKIKDITKNYANTSLKDMATQSGKMFSDISVWAENVFNSYEINWKGLYSAATGISESLFTKFAGFPGLALDAYFSFSKGTQKIAMAYQMARSLNVPYSIIYSSFDDGYVTPDNVIVHTDGNIDSDAVLQVFKIGSDDTIDAILNSDDPLEAYEIYNISFVKNDTLVQPNGKVKVYLPIPDGMVGNTCKVYRRESDDTWTVLDAYIEGSYLVFETDHFSVYALVGNRDELVITSPAEKTEYKYGETLDTSGLVLSYAGEEIKRGYICSPSVLIGSGEQEITVTFGLAQTKFTVTVDDENGNVDGLKFADSDTDGIIDEAGGKVYIYPKNIGGITVGEFRSLFKNEIKVNFDDGENAFNGMTFTFVNREYTLIIRGDAQANGKINASDARTILRIAARLDSPDDVTKEAADVDSDGKVTSKEARSVLRFAAKLQNKLYE